MDQGSYRPRAATEYRDRSPYRSRPDRIAFWALMLAVFAMLAGAVSARAGSGGMTSGTGDSGSRYERIWKQEVRDREKRWARRTSECESGGDAKAISSGGTYRGAFQFTRRTWRNAPKSPGGDPVDYPWRTQAVVAVYLKRHVGTSPWPNCG